MRLNYSRRGLVLGGLVAAVLALAAGIAYAAIPDSNSKVFTACMLKNVGTIRLIDPALGSGSLMGHCSSLETLVSWNQQGQPGTNGTNGTDGTKGTNGTDGTNGVSPTVAQLAVGDVNCPAGGAAITDAAGSTAYVCSGRNGADGADFAGAFTSPDGHSRLRVDDTGISLETLGGRLNLGTTDARLDSATALTLDAATTLSVKGTNVTINGPGCSPALRTTDQVQTVLPGTAMGFPGGSFPGILFPGSFTVCIG